MTDQDLLRIVNRELFQIRFAITALPEMSDRFAVVNATAGRLLHRAIERGFAEAGLEFYSFPNALDVLFPFLGEWTVNDLKAASNRILEEVRLLGVEQFAILGWFDPAEQIYRPIFPAGSTVDLQNLPQLLMQDLKALLQQATPRPSPPPDTAS